MTVIQNIILPELALGAPLNMYFRVNKADFNSNDSLEAQAEYNYRAKILTLRGGNKYYFNTYYNGLSVQVWRENCAVNSLALTLRGKGRVRTELALMQHESDFARSRHDILTQKVLAQFSLELTAEGVSLPIEIWPQLKHGILYLSLQAEDERAEFYGGAFTTSDTPKAVRLGIVITHFNRKQWLLPALKRLKRDILANPLYREHISIAVADNSRNISADEAQGADILPNPNYGGAGGFARGLLHWQDKGFSHCLFMDDDASCETESIYRTLALLQYARCDNLAVSGAMLREAEPHLLWAKGEYYSRFEIHNPKRGLDMRCAAHLLLAEEPNQNNSRHQYGGFWHFAFPIAEVKHYPFPFFVRGDDMLFGLVNNFHIITMNGIGNFAEDFCIKEAPFIAYLHTRSNFALEAVSGSPAAEIFIRRYKRWLRGQLYAYNYAHGRAVSLAALDFMQGLSFWRNNMDLSAVRQRLAQQADGEKAQEQEQAARGQMRRPMFEGKCQKLFRKLTRQGFLLPLGFIKDETALIPKNFGGNPALSFRRKRIFYYTEDLRHGYYAKYDKSRFWQEWNLGRKIRRNMQRNLPAVLKDYRQNWQNLACESFWRNVYAAETAEQAAKTEPIAAASRPAISILVPVYNVAAYLCQCLDSLLAQSFGDYEILCLNDGSTDGSGQILQAYAAGDKRIKIINKPNSGYGDTMNLGLQKAAGKYIAILESDDYMESNMLQRLYNLAQKHDLDIARCNYYKLAGGVKTKEDLSFVPQGKVICPAENPAVFYQAPAIWANLYRSSLVKKLRFLPTPGASYQDTSFIFKAYAECKRFMFIDEPLLNYRMDNPNSSVNSSQKAFAVCAEYAEILSFAKARPQLYAALKEHIPLMRYACYAWNCARLSPALRRPFLRQWSREIKADYQENRINEALYSAKKLKRLRIIRYLPWFYARRERIL